MLLLPSSEFDPTEVRYAAVWKPKPGDLASQQQKAADQKAALQKAEEERRKRNDRRASDDRRREPRVLVDTGQKRPDRRSGPRRNSD